MRKSETQWLTRIGVMLPFLLLNGIAFGQTKEIEITVDHPRPMEAAILKLEELSGIPINYEGVPFYYAADLKDVTDQAQTTPPPGVRLLAPKGGQLSFSVAVDEATGKLNDLEAVKDALSSMISAYNSSGLPGGFDFKEYNGVFFVKPVSYRDEKGATQAMKPLLSTLITLPEEKRDWSLTIRLILQQLSKVSGSLVGLGSGPMLPSGVAIGANNEPAEYVIARVLTAMVCPSSRSDLCQPAIAQNSWDVGFHFHLSYAPGYGYLFSIGRVPNSRWFVPPTPAQPYTPPTRSPDDGRFDTKKP